MSGRVNEVGKSTFDGSSSPNQTLAQVQMQVKQKEWKHLSSSVRSSSLLRQMAQRSSRSSSSLLTSVSLWPVSRGTCGVAPGATAAELEEDSA